MVGISSPLERLLTSHSTSIATAGSVVEIQWSPQSLFRVIVSSAMVPSHVVQQLLLVDFSGTAWPVRWLTLFGGTVLVVVPPCVIRCQMMLMDCFDIVAKTFDECWRLRAIR